jgi:catechol 2,3-dioxygenase-like lactoylglutathione lyase family enzyme
MADPKPVTSPGLRLQPMVHVADMAASVAFYERLGGEIVHGGRDGDWTLMQLGTTQIGLLARPPAADEGESVVELNFSAEATADELRRAIPGARSVTDRDFGEQVVVRSPDGLLIKISPVEPAG